MSGARFPANVRCRAPGKPCTAIRPLRQWRFALGWPAGGPAEALRTTAPESAATARGASARDVMPVLRPRYTWSSGYASDTAYAPGHAPASRPPCPRRMADGRLDSAAGRVPAAGPRALRRPGHRQDLLDGGADGAVLGPACRARAVSPGPRGCA